MQRVLTRARDDGAAVMVLYTLTRLAMIDLAAGRWADAIGDATEAVSLGELTGHHVLADTPAAILMLLAAYRGDTDTFTELNHGWRKRRQGRRPAFSTSCCETSSTGHTACTWSPPTRAGPPQRSIISRRCRTTFRSGWRASTASRRLSGPTRPRQPGCGRRTSSPSPPPRGRRGRPRSPSTARLSWRSRRRPSSISRGRSSITGGLPGRPSRRPGGSSTGLGPSSPTASSCGAPGGGSTPVPICGPRWTPSRT